MAIIVSKNGKNAKRVNKAVIDQENYLQQYIYDNPDAVPVYEIDEDIRLLILAREFGTASGPIDALGVDQNGNIYLIETKLYKNPDKRTVVAQVLDYGASLWRSSIDFAEFTSQLEKHVSKQFQSSLNDEIQNFFGLDSESTSQLLASMQTNLSNGIFKFVVLMDSLHRQLKDLILFINRNSQFDVYAVELEYYKHNEFEIIIPKLYGAEIKKEVQSTTTNRTPISREDFLANMQQPADKTLAEKLLATFENDPLIKLTWRRNGFSLSVNIPNATEYPRNYAFFFFHRGHDGQSAGARLDMGYPEDAWRLVPVLHPTIKNYRDFYTTLKGYRNARIGDLTVFDEKVTREFIDLISSTAKKISSQK